MSRILKVAKMRPVLQSVLFNTHFLGFDARRQLVKSIVPTRSKATNCTSEAPKPKPGYFASGGTHAVFSDLPKPQGDFMKEWHAKNSKYNLVLLSGVLALAGAVALCISTGHPQFYATVPDYPYTDDEMERFEEEEERRQQEKSEREKLKQDMRDEKELKVRRRKAKEAMAREVELMQKDLKEEGINDSEMTELIKLIQEREQFEIWEREEVQRLEENERKRMKLKEDNEMLRKEQMTQRAKQRKQI